MTQDEINAVKKAAEKMRKQESAQGEIIEMAQECGLIGMRPHLDGIYSAHLVAFAHLVADKEQKKWQDQTAVEIYEAVLEEREACAKLCDSFQARDVGMQPAECAGAIRARGEQA